MTKLLNIALASCFVFMLAGCKDSDYAQWRSLGKPHRVTVYSGGVLVKVYEATGNVSNSDSSDGWSFMDKKTGKLVEVAGTITIEQE